MGDACCAHDEPAEVEEAPAARWRVREVQAAGAVGVLVAGGVVAGAAGGDGLSAAFFVAALIVGGWTFAPEAVWALGRGRLGVGPLMTIAAAGAVMLGELGEAAALAFLFSVHEGLEGDALARARRGLRALLALVPERVTIRRGDTDALVDLAVILSGLRVARVGTIPGGLR